MTNNKSASCGAERERLGLQQQTTRGKGGGG
jgi:hypothetical protein